MTPLRQCVTVLGFSAVLLVVGVTGALGVIVLSNGVLATAAPAWTTELQVAGRPVEINVAGLVRLATAPGSAVLLDGRAFATSAGRITLRREGRAIVASCTPCRLQHPALAATPLQLLLGFLTAGSLPSPVAAAYSALWGLGGLILYGGASAYGFMGGPPRGRQRHSPQVR